MEYAIPCNRWYDWVYEIDNNYCEYIHDFCEYITVCKKLENICVKDILGKDLFNKPCYKPEVILERIERNKNKKGITI